MSIKLSKQLKLLPWLTRSNVLWGAGIALALSIAIALVAALATGKLKFGIGAGTTTVTSEKTDSQGKVIERTITTSTQDAKTLWDWLHLTAVLGVPLTLANLGYLVKLVEQEQAENTLQEEVLQHYLDRVSNLVIEKNLLAIAAKDAPTTEETELLDVSVDIIRALTLSTLRRLSDGSRKASVVRLLVEAGLIQRLGVSLQDANLRFANLDGANLNQSNLSGADLYKANLRFANLDGANLNQSNLSGASFGFTSLKGASFEGANLSDASFDFFVNLNGAILTVSNLNGAKLDGAKLNGASLDGANLYEADLRFAEELTEGQLETAYIYKTKLPQGIDIDHDRDCGKPYNEWLAEKIESLLRKREAQRLQE
jgi:hypothetical protein